MQESKICGRNCIDVVFGPITHNWPPGENAMLSVSMLELLTPETLISASTKSSRENICQLLGLVTKMEFFTLFPLGTVLKKPGTN